MPEIRIIPSAWEIAICFLQVIISMRKYQAQPRNAVLKTETINRILWPLFPTISLSIALSTYPLTKKARVEMHVCWSQLPVAVLR